MPLAVRIERIAQAVADQVNAQNGKNNEQAGIEPHPPRAALDKGLRAGEHVAPRSRRRLHAQSQEGNVRLDEDGPGQPQRGRDDNNSSVLGIR